MASSSIQGLFAEQARRTPDATAVSAANGVLTYRDLDRRSAGLAHRLAGLGACADTPVAVLMRRSADLVVALLAILKAGGYYLPMDEALTPERAQRVMAQFQPRVLLTDQDTARRGLPHAEQVIVVDSNGFPERDQPAHTPYRPDQLACVLRTSEANGQQKAVAVTAGNLLALVLDPIWEGIWEDGRHERVLMSAPCAGYPSPCELWVPLVRGGRVVVPPPGKLEIDTLRRLIADEEITAALLPAGLFRKVASEAPGCLAGLRAVLTSGDVIPPAAVQRVLDACPDTTVRVMSGSAELTSVCANATAPQMLDEQLRQVRAVEAGEAYVPGAQPVGPARVQRVLAGFPGVADVAVLVYEIGPGDSRLVAYLVRATHDWDVTQLRAHALESLPEHMVPEAFLVLDELPLAPDGTLRRDALPVPDAETSATYRAPRTATEEILCSAFAEAFGVGRIGVGDSFVQLGGHSRLAMRLVERIQEALHVELPINELFEHPTVAELAAELDRRSGSCAGAPVPIAGLKGHSA